MPHKNYSLGTSRLVSFPGNGLDKFFLTLEHFAPTVPKRIEGAVVAGGVSDHEVTREMQCCQAAQLIKEELSY